VLCNVNIGIYSTLFVGILFFGRSLLRVLKPSLEQRSVLAFRLGEEIALVVN